MFYFHFSILFRVLLLFDLPSILQVSIEGVTYLFGICGKELTELLVHFTGIVFPVCVELALGPKILFMLQELLHFLLFQQLGHLFSLVLSLNIDSDKAAHLRMDRQVNGLLIGVFRTMVGAAF